MFDRTDPADAPANVPKKPAPDALAAKAVLVHERLCVVYECPIAYFHHLDPLSELVSSLLSHRTRNADSGRAFKALRGRYPEWSQVRDAPAHAVQALIGCCTWPELKAPRVQQVLREVTARRGGDLSLEFLGGLDVAEARAWLEELPGVGPKTSAAVLSFSSLRQRALPVDSHHHRVATRLGLVGPKASPAAAHEILASQLPTDWDAQQVYDNHEVLMLHGQRCCFYEGPECHRCAVLDLCPFGQSRLAKRTASAATSGAGPTAPPPGHAAEPECVAPVVEPRAARDARRSSDKPSV